MSALERLTAAVTLVVILLLGGAWWVRHYGAERYQAGHAAAIAERAQADDEAVRKRTAENAAKAVSQADSNVTITEKKHEEIQPVRERIVTQRVYVGSALCGDRLAGPAETQGAAGSDSANPPGWLVRPDVERDLIALKLAVEEDLATGRACQRVLQDEGMVP